MKSSRNYAIDLIRGLSILYIVGYWHLFNYTEAFRGYSNPFTHNLTRIILGSFVFVSGYLIAAKNLELNWKSILKFWQKRLIRIYPLYAISLILFYLCHLADIWTLVRAAFLISMFFPPSPPTLWFVTMIMIFYLIAPILLKTSTKLSLYLPLVMLIMFLFLQLNGSSELRLFFPSFCLGIFFKLNNFWQNKICKNQAILTIIFILLYWVNIFKVKNQLIDEYLHILLITIGALLCYLYSCKIPNKIKQSAIINVISNASFCMYLFHRPIFSLSKNIFFPINELEQVLFLIFVPLPVTIIIAWLSQKLYDRLLENIGKAIARRTV